MSKTVLDLVTRTFKDAIVSSHAHRGDETIAVDKARVVEVATFLRDDERCAFDHPIDVTAVDYLTYGPAHPYPGNRYAVVYHLRSMTHKHRIRLVVPVDGDEPTVPSLTPLWKGLVWFERETFDMYGIIFEGHPDLRRILMYDDFVGHPLRKDYPVRGYQPRVDMPRLVGDPVPGVHPEPLEE